MFRKIAAVLQVLFICFESFSDLPVNQSILPKLWIAIGLKTMYQWQSLIYLFS
jgi:hypothetical protein